MANSPAKFAVLSTVREALYGVMFNSQRMPEEYPFPFVDVTKMSEDELLDQLREDTATALARLG
jgi:hypothetical protein